MNHEEHMYQHEFYKNYSKSNITRRHTELLADAVGHVASEASILRQVPNDCIIEDSLLVRRSASGTNMHDRGRGPIERYRQIHLDLLREGHTGHKTLVNLDVPTDFDERIVRVPPHQVTFQIGQHWNDSLLVRC